MGGSAPLIGDKMSEEQVGESVEEAFQEMQVDLTVEILESLKEIENQVYESSGDPDIVGQTWAIVSSALAAGTDEFEENRIQVVLTGQGEDLFAGLADERLAVATSLIKGKIGTMIRTGAWLAPTSDFKASEHPEKKSCIISGFYLAQHIFFIVRDQEQNVIPYVISRGQFENGEAQKHTELIEALLDFHYLPMTLKLDDPASYEEILDSILETIEEEES